jgi:succinoglycan biosynthesis transport protein ExoP
MNQGQPPDQYNPPPHQDDSYRGYKYYGGYGYDYGGYDAYYSNPKRRSIKDYFIIFRERVWLFIFCFAIIVTGVLLYTLNKTPLYRSSAQIRMLRVSNAPMDSPHEKNPELIDNQQDLNTWTDILKSHKITQEVEKRLKSDEALYNQFMKPYQEMADEEDAAPIVAYPFLHSNRRIIPKRLSLIIGIEYTHPDREMAAFVVNLYAQAFRDYQTERMVKGGRKNADVLTPKIEEHLRKVNELEQQVVEYKSTHGGLAIDANKDIYINELQSLRALLNNYQEEYRQKESYWQQITLFEQHNRPILSLHFIAEAPQVAALVTRLSQKTEIVGQLAIRYRDKHPKMIEARQSLELTQQELTKAVNIEREKTYNAYIHRKNLFEETQKAVDDKETNYQDLEANRQEYNRLQQDLEKARKVLDHLEFSKTKEEINTETKSSTIENLDLGAVPKDPFSPNIILNIAVGVILGTGFGLFMVYFTAFLDNRVKSPFDIEQVIKLPLIGVLPQIRKMDAFRKARIFESGKDNHVKEAFLSIYSTLGVNDAAKDAQVYLNTSTIPSEGKSFVSTNLAFSFAESGDRVLLLDCDLRLPNIAKSLQLQPGYGLLNYVKGEIELGDAIQPDVYPNLDVMSAGGRSRTPMTVFNNEVFGQMLDELRSYYDRIIIDSPPLAAVSDALNIVPHVDGVLFVIKYDTVKINTAALTVRKLKEAGKPIFGVILNSMKSRVAASYYYSEYYTGRYKKYYTDAGSPLDGKDAA